ncbi:MAG: cell division protein CrgA, partial [Nitrosopumilaceae archaeon]|nr:cell division protein CrgA [Nitrosopumilaceae archaeon]
MPKSRIRKKKKDNRPAPVVAETGSVELESPRWLAPTMIGAFLIGLFWIVIFYVSQTQYP